MEGRLHLRARRRGLPECDRYSADTQAYLEQITPAAVVLNTTFFSPAGEEDLVPGIAQTLSALAGLGTEVIALRDQPRLTIDPIACTEQKGPQDPPAPRRCRSP